MVGKRYIAVASNMAVAGTLLLVKAFEIGVKIFKRMFNNFLRRESGFKKHNIFTTGLHSVSYVPLQFFSELVVKSDKQNRAWLYHFV